MTCEIYNLDCRDALDLFVEPKSVQMCVTSPPYFGLRDYGVDGQLGLEKTPELYIEQMVSVFRSVRNVLRDDGTLWLNIGDSYARTGGTDRKVSPTATVGNTVRSIQQMPNRTQVAPINLKEKDLIGIPWMLAFALRADGWYLRQDIIWAKPNPMPESVTDRCTKAHEYLFLLSKSAKYFIDPEGMKEPAVKGASGSQFHTGKTGEHQQGRASTKPRSKADTFKREGSKREVAIPGQSVGTHRPDRDESDYSLDTRNRRSVWTVATRPYKGAHFACVDEGTECLTINGWKRHADLVAGVLAAQFDMTTGLLSWASIEDIARYPVVNQLMVAAKSRDVEMLLTPNHRTIVARRDKETRQWKSLSIIRADEMKPSHAVPVSAAWQESGNEPFSADWAELIGWYLAEGCESGSSWSVEIYQSQAANPEKVARIRALLLLLGAEFLEATAPRVWFGRNATMVAFQVRGFAAVMLRQWAPGKRFHPSVLGWSAGLLDRLLIGLVDGDGHRRADGRFSFIQRDENSASLAQAIGVRLGYSTMLSRRTGNTFAVYFTRKRLISFRGTGGEGAEIMQRPYTGIVWCPKLPAGTWVARKNGRSFITGNTFPPALIEPCILAGSRPGDLVLDPFMGSGTTAQVALQHGRRAIGCELNAEYLPLISQRTAQYV